MKIEITKTSEQAKNEKQAYKEFVAAVDICPHCGHRNHSFRFNYKREFKNKTIEEISDCFCSRCKTVWSVFPGSEEKDGDAHV